MLKYRAIVGLHFSQRNVTSGKQPRSITHSKTVRAHSPIPCCPLAVKFRPTVVSSLWFRLGENEILSNSGNLTKSLLPQRSNFGPQWFYLCGFVWAKTKYCQISGDLVKILQDQLCKMLEPSALSACLRYYQN